MKRSRRLSAAATLATMLFTPALAQAGTAYQEVWYPDGQIRWFNKDVTNAGTNIQTAMDFLASRTPLQITALSSATSANLTFSKAWTLNSGSGMTYGYWLENRADNNKVIELATNGTISVGTIVHETMHALGFAHEFQRPEREDFVDMCVNADPFNYGTIGNAIIPGAHWNLSPYDFASVTNGGYTCQTALPGVEQQSRVYQGETNRLSIHDINSLYRMYQDELGSHADGDRLGHAVATGDFDDDDIEDIAVAAAEPSSGSFSLRIYFYKGVMTDPHEEPGVGTSYVPWFRHTIGTTSSSGARLVLASGDFNGDGISDLAVGQPAHNSNKGRVQILFVNTGRDDDNTDDYAPWGRYGIKATYTLLPQDVGLSIGTTGRFGSALAVGKLTSRVYPYDLGDDTPFDDLIIGAPTASSMLVGGPKGGAVVHVQGREEPTAASWTHGDDQVKWNPGSTGDEFGAAISVIPGMCDSADSSSFYNDVYIVGAPGYNAGAGAVHLYGCATDEEQSLLSPPLLSTVTHPQPGARYGASVAGFRRRQSPNTVTYRYYAAIGAPRFVGSGTNPDSGIVYLDEYTLSGNKTFIDSYRPSARSGGDEFGHSVAVQQTAVASWVQEGSNEVYIAIGMPGTEVAGKPAGKVYVWRPWTSTGTLTGTATAISAVNPSTATDTRFGEALAVLRNLDTNGGFVAGAPKSAEIDVVITKGIPVPTPVNAGSADVLLNAASGSWSWTTSRRHLHQETTGDRRPTN